MMAPHRFFLKIVRRRRLRADLEAELTFHREMGGPKGTAFRLGIQQPLRKRRWIFRQFNALENTWRDLLLVLRRFRHNRVYAAAAVGSLALGIGISTAMFAILNTVVFRSLPYPNEKSLFWLSQVLKANSTDELTITADVLDWRRFNHTLESMAAFNYPTILF